MIDQTTSRPDRPLELFISASEADRDREMLDRLEKHLSMLTRTGVITAWHRGRIVPGAERARAIDERLSRAQVILLLVSPEYVEWLKSDDAELSRAMARHASGETRVVPILLRPAVWEALPFAKLQVLPKDLKPVSEHRDKDRVFQRIARGIDEAIQDFLERRPERPAGVTRYQNVPRSGVRSFVGRSSALEHLHTLLRAHDRVSIAAITGMGGLGKSELALQYALEQLRRGGYPGGICWLKARSLDLHGQLLTFARDALGLAVPDGLEPADRIRYIFRSWPEGEVLFVFDDVTGLEPLLPYLPENAPRFRVLLTTRQDRLSPHFQQLSLDVLAEAPALELLGALAGEARVREELEAARALCLELGYLPLGLELAGRYLWRKPDLSLGEFLERLREKGLAQKALREADPDMTAPLGVEAAFELSWEAVRHADARELACLLSVFALAPVPWPLVEACLPEEDAEDLEDRRDELVALHLVKRRARGSYELHPLVHRWLRGKLKRSNARLWTERLIDSLNATFPSASEGNWEHSQLLIEHVRATRDFIKEFDLCSVVASRLLNEAGRYLVAQGRYDDAEPLLRHALSMRERLSDSDDPLIANSLMNLGEMLRLKGRYPESVPVIQRALRIRESLHGPDHPDTAKALTILASLYRVREQFAESEALHKRALAIRIKHFGPEHLLVAGSLNMMSRLLVILERFEEAEQYYKRALAIHESAGEKSNSRIDYVLKNLASLYIQWPDHLEKARPLLERALAFRQTRFGLEHPYVATVLNLFGQLARKQGRLDEAEDLYHRARVIWERVMGPVNDDVGRVIHNQGQLQYARGRLDEAEALLRLALSVREKAVGPDHLDTASTLFQLARLLERRGQLGEAECCHGRAARIAEQKLPPNHSRTASYLEAYGRVLQALGRMEAAGEISERAERMWEQVRQDLRSLHRFA